MNTCIILRSRTVHTCTHRTQHTRTHKSILMKSQNEWNYTVESQIIISIVSNGTRERTELFLVTTPLYDTLLILMTKTKFCNYLILFCSRLRSSFLSQAQIFISPPPRFFFLAFFLCI